MAASRISLIKHWNSDFDAQGNLVELCVYLLRQKEINEKIQTHN